MNPPNVSRLPAPTSLGHYIRKALRPSHTFPHRENIHSPTLQHGTTNRILIYRGSFNPPHKGHLALLNYAFANCWRDLNIILAIILPLDDHSVFSKVSSTESDDRKLLKLTRDERVKIWLGYGGLPGYYWVFPDFSFEWPLFEDNLLIEVEGAGFSLEFCYLFGADHMKNVPCRYYWSRCRNLISSDVGRDTEMAGASGMGQLGDYDPWEDASVEKVEVNTGDLFIMTPVASPQPDYLQLGFGDIEGILKKGELEAIAGSSRYTNVLTIRFFVGLSSPNNTTETTMIPAPRVWTCRLRENPRNALWFLQKPQGVNLHRFSSTELRDLIDKHVQENKISATVPAEVEELALNADILWEFVRKWAADNGMAA